MCLCCTHRICLGYFCRQVQQHREYQLSATSSQCLFVSNNNFYVFWWAVYNFYFRGTISKALQRQTFICAPLIFRVWCNHSAEYSPTSRSLWCLTKPAIKRRQLMNSQRRQLRNTSSVRWQKFLQRGTWEPKILSQQYFLNCPATN